MKSFVIAFLFLLLASNSSFSQSFRSPDKSQLDVAYLPDHFAHDRTEGQKAIVKVYYSQPLKKGREIFGKKVPYGKVWRTGANEAVEFKAYQDISIGGKNLAAGTYSLFTIPGEKEWTIIINTELDYWGAYRYKQEHDVLRVTVPSSSMDKVVEAFSVRFEDMGDSKAVMRLAWDQTLVEVPIGY